MNTEPTSTCPNARALQAELPTCEEINRLCGADSASKNKRLLGRWRVHVIDHTRGRFCDGRPASLTVPTGPLTHTRTMSMSIILAQMIANRSILNPHPRKPLLNAAVTIPDFICTRHELALVSGDNHVDMSSGSTCNPGMQRPTLFTTSKAWHALAGTVGPQSSSALPSLQYTAPRIR